MRLQPFWPSSSSSSRRKPAPPSTPSADVSDGEASISSDVSGSSLPTVFSPGALVHNPNDDESASAALLRNRVDRLREGRLDGTIVNYVDR